MDILAQILEINLEINEEKRVLRELGLSEEEIDGYIEFFADEFFGEVEPLGDIH